MIWNINENSCPVEMKGFGQRLARNIRTFKMLTSVKERDNPFISTASVKLPVEIRYS